jgi:hypothetical protein
MSGRVGEHPEVALSAVVVEIEGPGAQSDDPLLSSVDVLHVEVEMELLRVVVGGRPVGRREVRRELT